MEQILSAEEIKVGIYDAIRGNGTNNKTVADAVFELFQQYARQMADKAFEAGYSKAAGVFNDMQSPNKEQFLNELFK